MNAATKQLSMDINREIITEIHIQAPSQKVWEILTDFENYTSWNPFIIKSEGKLELGSKLTNHLKLNGKVNVFKPEITLIEAGKHFEWMGSAPLGVFNGNHYFILEATGANSCKFIHGERFSGWLRGLILKQVGQETLAQFKQMNQALKEAAEA